MVRLLLFTIGISLVGVHSASVAAADPQAVTVVELFTSQGCSSCPPADVVLRKLSERKEADKQLLCLSFHVDYWNRLGWTDPYSQAAFSQRQRSYARLKQNGRVYTPQMVLNGQYAFVGSNAELTDRYLSHLQKLPSSMQVTLAATTATDGQIAVSYRVTGETKNRWLQVALVNQQEQNAVPRGENQGRTLAHANVVRVFKTIELADAAQGRVSLALPKGVKADAVKIIGYVQDKTTLHIDGGSAITP